MKNLAFPVEQVTLEFHLNLTAAGGYSPPWIVDRLFHVPNALSVKPLRRETRKSLGGDKIYRW